MRRVTARIGEQPLPVIAACLGGSGVILNLGAAKVRVQSRIGEFAHHLWQLYGALPFIADDTVFADFHVAVRGTGGLRAVWRPQARFFVDGVPPFDPFPRRNALPLFEWGVNWCVAKRFNQFVLLHAGTLAVDGRAVILAAPPGSGKSTLSAAMMLRGFRLLSDEFGVLDPASGHVWPLLKPVALKNASVEVIRSFDREAKLGPLFTGTRKGDVAHLAPDDASATAMAEPVRPALVLFPRYRAGARVHCQRLAGEQAFARLAFNSFNYALLGARGFHAVADVIERCPAYELVFGSLDEAIDTIGNLLAESGEMPS